MYALFMLFAALAMLGQLRALRGGRPRDWALCGVGDRRAAVDAVLRRRSSPPVQHGGVRRSRRGACVRAAARSAADALAGSLGRSRSSSIAIAPLAQFCSTSSRPTRPRARASTRPSRPATGDTRGQASRASTSRITNLVWAICGYHADDVMALVAALWPLAILGALMLLGRRARPLTRLVVACALVPAFALFALGALKPFLFEVRYFVGAVPLLLCCSRARRPAGRAARGALAASVACSSRPRRSRRPTSSSTAPTRASTTSRARWRRSASERRPGDVLLYQPRTWRTSSATTPTTTSSAARWRTTCRRDRHRIFVVASVPGLGEQPPRAPRGP